MRAPATTWETDRRLSPKTRETLRYAGLLISSQAVAESGGRGSNSRPSAWEADALPTELPPPESRSIAADYPCGGEALRRPHRRRRAGGCPRRAAGLRRRRAARRHLAGLGGAQGAAAPRARRGGGAAGARRLRAADVGAAARQGRGPQLLGFVVRAVRTGGAGPRARAAQARGQRHGAGRDLQGR